MNTVEELRNTAVHLNTQAQKLDSLLLIAGQVLLDGNVDSEDLGNLITVAWDINLDTQKTIASMLGEDEWKNQP
ncbi:hypothetical protein QX227_08100 [Pectobacterium aroidearum]|uniref:hypothetical protein n=1 Tax=Pectobacterium aroidearum TaxID=1201031 RepID=UPI002FCB8A1A